MVLVWLGACAGDCGETNKFSTANQIRPSFWWAFRLAQRSRPKERSRPLGTRLLDEVSCPRTQQYSTAPQETDHLKTIFHAPLYYVITDYTFCITDLVQTRSYIFQEMSITTGQRLKEKKVRHRSESYTKPFSSTII